MASREGWRKWNQLKKAILTKLREVNTLTSHDVSKAFDISVNNAGMTLLKLYRQRLVDREPIFAGFRKPLYRYQITNRGVKRVLWYEQQQESD